MSELKKHVKVCDNCEFFDNEYRCEKRSNTIVENNFYCECYKDNTHIKELREHLFLELKGIIRDWYLALSPMSRELCEIIYKMIDDTLRDKIFNGDE